MFFHVGKQGTSADTSRGLPGAMMIGLMPRAE